MAEKNVSEIRRELSSQSRGGCPYRGAPTNSDALPANHYCVHVSYAPLPSIDVLEREWGGGSMYFGRLFSLHSSCIGMDCTPGKRVFYVHRARGVWESDKQIVWGLRQRNTIAPNGYRPATHEETYEFAMARLELVNFVGLGSFVRCQGHRDVVCVWQNGDQRVLGYDWFDCVGERKLRVLFVSK